ncbi:MAG: alpha/beta fold hydrolase [Gemmatimonadota bacterium]
MRSTKLGFPGAAGERLVGRLDLPADGAPHAYALFAHCFTCSKDLKAAVNLSRALAGARIAVFRFDFTGLGESEGDFADTNFSSNVEDLVAAARFLEREHGPPAILVGHSLGGAAVIRAAAEVPSARAVATIGAPCDPAHIRHHLTGSLEEIEERGEAEITLAGRSFRIRRHFLEDLEETRMREAIADLGRALLIFHSPVDQVVGIENAARIYEAARHPKSFISLDGADHLLTRRADSLWTGRVLAAWASRYVEAPEEGPPRAADREGGVVVRTGRSGYRTAILAGGHPLVADEPLAVGGTDEGPTPYDLLAASLGACTSITLRMYADRKGWPLEEIRVRLAHRKVHAEDERQCESEPARMDEIRRTITLEGELEAVQRARLMEIADRCPVHRTLEAGVCVVTEERPGD